MWFVAVHSGWRLQPLNDREPDLVALTHALGCFLSDADGQAHAGLKACHINQVLSLHRWKHARYQRGSEQREEKEWNKNKEGGKEKDTPAQSCSMWSLHVFPADDNKWYFRMTSAWWLISWCDTLRASKNMTGKQYYLLVHADCTTYNR